MAQKVGSEACGSGDSGLGTTRRRTIQISGDDGSVFLGTVYTGVNVTTDPELLDPLMEGTLNEVESPTEEGRIYRPAVPVIYHDEERKIFALVIPEVLRHEEFDCRRELLDQLASRREVIPGYMRRFEVVFDPRQLNDLGKEGQLAGPKEKTQLIERPATDAEVNHLRQQLQEKEQQLEKLQSRLEQTESGERPPTGGSVGPEELEERVRELDEREQQLEIDREQLDEVADRVERDSARIDEVSRRNEELRAELEHREQQLREKERKLQVRELNLEQKELEIQKEHELAMAGGLKPYANERTQVVTEDQFIEVVDAASGSGQAALASAAVADSEAVEAARPRRPEPTSRMISPSDSEQIEAAYPQEVQEDWFVRQTADLVLVGYRIGEERQRGFLEGEVEFLFQVHEVEGIPFIGLTLAAFDEDSGCVDAVTAPMSDRGEEQSSILDKVARDLHVYLAVYGEDGQLVAAWEAGGPLRRNIGWARQRLRQWRDSVEDPEVVDVKAAEFLAENPELVGSMRHPFESQSFSQFDGAADVKLAASIVGYWSEPEQFDYLIGNRSFSLQAFLNVQKRVVRQALHWGLAFGEALQQVAVEESIILDEKSMVQRMLSNFAEVCVGLRANDLDPLEQWENWDRLIEMAEEHRVTPDPDVLELAESSLKRAEEYEAVVEEQQEFSRPDGEAAHPVDKAEVQVEERYDDDSGVTYFVAAGSEDQFAELWQEERDELESLLADEDLRVVAAQILLEQHGSDAVVEVMEAVEEMEAAEARAVSRFCEERADELEAGLMQALDSAGPAATMIAGRALAKQGSAAALPRLLATARDDSDHGWLVPCLVDFGDKLLPPLSRVLKEDPEDEGLLSLLAALETYREGILDELSDERNEKLQEALGRARRLL